MSRLPTLFALLVVGWVVACSDDPDVDRNGGPLPQVAGADGGGDEPITFCAALQVVRQKCQRCHAEDPLHGAPVPFITYEDFQRPYGSGDRKYWEEAAESVERGSMPYLVLNEPPTSLMPKVEPLTVDEKATLLGWLKQGALPEGGTECP